VPLAVEGVEYPWCVSEASGQVSLVSWTLCVSGLVVVGVGENSGDRTCFALSISVLLMNWTLLPVAE
jgi:hypothetical protein